MQSIRYMDMVRLVAALCLGLPTWAGCGSYGSVTQEDPPVQEQVEPKKPPPPKRLVRQPDEMPTEKVRPSDSGEMTATSAIDLVWSAIDESLEYEPVLAVWVLDTTASAQSTLAQSSARLQQYYRERAATAAVEAAGEASESEKPNLFTAIVAFGSEVKFLLEEPNTDVDAVTAALDATQVDSSEQERTFAAVRTALDRYGPLRESKRWKIIICVITDEAGDDWRDVDELIPQVKRSLLPVYVIGTPAPMGRVSISTAATDEQTSAAEKPAPDWVPRRHGPESRYPELVDFQTITVGSEMRLVDSGYGPFGLEWLCRASGGGFIALRPKPIGGYVGLMADDWPSPYVPRFDRHVMSRYLPDYVSESDYQALLQSNAAARALHQATKLGDPTLLVPPQMHFPKNNDAQLNADLSNAQISAARVAPALKKLYDALKEGEVDRPKLQSPRWQAAYDLAFGRASIGKVRADSYNSKLAQLKRGLAFANPNSTIWILEAADEYSDSNEEKIAARGREALQRVVTDHPGTPWAAMAERELAAPAGWRWAEQ